MSKYYDNPHGLAMAKLKANIIDDWIYVRFNDFNPIEW